MALVGLPKSRLCRARRPLVQRLMQPGRARQSLQSPKTLSSAKRSPARYLWAMLMARIFEVFLLVCPLCTGQMRIIAFIVDGAEVRKILEHIGVDAQAPRITPARGPPLWDDCDAAMVDGVDVEPEWDPSAQIAPDNQIDQRISW